MSITPCLWFPGTLAEALEFYTGLFPDSRVISKQHYPDGSHRLLMAEWDMLGTRFQGLNEKPGFPFTEAVSFAVACEDQAEVDRYWYGLIGETGEESQCGWLKDRFGISWQIVPKRMYDLLADTNRARANAAMQAMLTMRRLVVADLEAAADAAGEGQS